MRKLVFAALLLAGCHGRLAHVSNRIQDAQAAPAPRKWAELSVTGHDEAKVRQAAAALSENPGLLLKLYQHDTTNYIWWWRTYPWPVHEAGELSALGVSADNICDEAVNGFIFASGMVPLHTETFTNLGVCAAWRQ